MPILVYPSHDDLSCAFNSYPTPQQVPPPAAPLTMATTPTHVLNVIGKGAYGTVFRCQWPSIGEFALKISPRRIKDADGGYSRDNQGAASMAAGP